MFNSLYNAKFSDLDLPKPTRMGFDTIDWEEEIEALMSEMCEYESFQVALEKRMEYKGDDPNEFWHLFRLEDEVGLKELIAAA